LGAKFLAVVLSESFSVKIKFSRLWSDLVLHRVIEASRISFQKREAAKSILTRMQNERQRVGVNAFDSNRLPRHRKHKSLPKEIPFGQYSRDGWLVTIRGASFIL
jgi:hypothetical protein